MLDTIQLNKIIPDPEQPRQKFIQSELIELQNSIEAQGILSPLLVESNYQDDNYLLLDGERRYRCAKELQLEKVPVKVITGPLSFVDRTTIRFHVQEQHKDWSELDKAKAIYEYKKITRKTIAEIAETLNLQVPKVHGYLRVTEFTQSGQQLINTHKIEFTYLIYLIRIVKYYLVICDNSQEDIEKKLISRITSEQFTNIKQFQLFSKILNTSSNIENKLKYLNDYTYTFDELIASSDILNTEELDSHYKLFTKADYSLATIIDTLQVLDKKNKDILNSIQEKLKSIL